MEAVLEVFKYVLPSLIVFLTAYFIFDSFTKSRLKSQYLDYKNKAGESIIPLRLQAYERMALLVERISPNSLIPRVKLPEMSSQEFQLALISNIRKEYEHNLTQQIYVSSTLWQLITNLKEETISMIMKIGSQLPEDASATDMSKAIFEFIVGMKVTYPTNQILDLLKQEVKELY